MKKKIFMLLALVITFMTASAVDVPTYSLTAVESGGTGTITFKVGESTVTSAAEGAEVTLTVTPPEGLSVGTVTGQWYAAAAVTRSIDLLKDVTLTAVEGQENQWTFTMGRANAEISATYKKVIQDSWIQDIAAVTYNGSAQKPTVTVKDGTTTLTVNTDYTVSYSNNTNAGTATVTVKGTGNYSGTAKKNFTIRKRSNSITQAPTAKKLTYTGEAQELVTAGTSRGGSWRYSLDGNTWTSAIPKGTEAGTYTVHYKVNSSTNYTAVSGSTVSVTIAPKVVDCPVIELDGVPDGGYDYNGEARQPTVLSVKDGETEIPAGEYTVGYQDNVDAGTASVVVSDVAGGNYEVSGTQTFTINRLSGDVYINPWQFERTYGDGPFTIDPYVTGDGALTYVSYDTDVATVDDNGRVTIVGTGTATIYAFLADGTNYTGDSDYCTVSVVAKTVENAAGTTVTEDEDGYHATIGEGEGSAGVVVGEVTTATLDYGRTLSGGGEKVTVDGEQVCLYTVCLPYAPTATGVKYYTLSGASGGVLSFREIEGSPQAYTPYVVAVTSSTQVGMTGTSVDFGHSVGNGGSAEGYELRGTLRGLGNAEAAAEHAYVLQADGHWHPVETTEPAGYIPPFRAYIVKTTGGEARQLVSSLGGTATGMALQTVDRDGTERWYDLNGRQVNQPRRGGMYMKQQNGNMRKVIKR